MEPDAAREHLEEEAARLRRLQAGFDAEHLHDQSSEEQTGDLAHFGQHEADAASATFEKEKDLSILDQVEAELTEVERALERLDAGSYGACEACGGAIGDERLEAQPATRFCITHQGAAERV